MQRSIVFVKDAGMNLCIIQKGRVRSSQDYPSVLQCRTGAAECKTDEDVQGHEYE